jgi:hypothetical protein
LQEEVGAPTSPSFSRNRESRLGCHCWLVQQCLMRKLCKNARLGKPAVAPANVSANISRRMRLETSPFPFPLPPGEGILKPSPPAGEGRVAGKLTTCRQTLNQFRRPLLATFPVYKTTAPRRERPQFASVERLNLVADYSVNARRIRSEEFLAPSYTGASDSAN